MNILLINPSPMPLGEIDLYIRQQSNLRSPDYMMPLSVMLLASMIRDNCKRVNKIQILDIAKELTLYTRNSQSTLQSFINYCLSKAAFLPDIVGISLTFSSAHNLTLYLADAIKTKWRNTKVMIGGNHATNMYKKLLEDKNINYVFRGPAESTIVEFIDNYNSIDPTSIQGVYNFNKAKLQNKAELGKELDINDLPMPAYDLIDMVDYRKLGFASIMFGRGCPFNCFFCCVHSMYGRKVRYKNNERIINELKYLNSNFGFDTFLIVDDFFPPPKPILLDLVEKVKSLSFNFKFSIIQGTAVSLLDEEIIDALISLGCKSFSLPIETGCEYTMKNIINKNISLDHVRKILRILRNKKVEINVFFILGFPRETKELMQETINFINSIDVDWVYIFYAMPFPGSRMLKELEETGILDSNKIDWDTFRFGIRGYDTPEISAKDLEELIYDTNIIRNFFNNSNLHNGRYEKAIQDFDGILKKYPFHIPARYCKIQALEKMGEKSEPEFDTCLEWIRGDKESKRLYERYIEYMPELKNRI